MTMFYFVRHGEATYSPVNERNFIGHGKDLAPLTENGVRQLKETSRDQRLKSCEIIVSSPYTRALQSAAIISKELDIDIEVDVDLHEWLPDNTFMFKTSEEAIALCNDFNLCKGVYPKNEERKWETIVSMKNRMGRVIEKYYTFNKVIVVCHEMVIRAITGMDIERKIKNGEIIEYCIGNR